MRKLALVGLLGLSQCISEPCMPDPRPFHHLDLRVAAMDTLLDTMPNCASYQSQYAELAQRYQAACETLTAPEQECIDFKAAVKNFRTTIQDLCPETPLYGNLTRP